MDNKVYWETKSGKKVDIDEMTIEHLRNTLKMIVRNREDRIIEQEFENYKYEKLREIESDLGLDIIMD